MSTSMDVDVSSVNNEVSSVNDPKPFVPFTGPEVYIKFLNNIIKVNIMLVVKSQFYQTRSCK